VTRYGGDHQALRRAAKPFAYGQPCSRCGQVMRPGQALDLDHRDDGTGWLGFAHARCNRQAGGRLGRARQIERARRKTLIDEYALGVEIAEDRRHTSVVAAGAVEGDVVLVDLKAYLDGPDATGVVLELLEERKAQASDDDPLPERKMRAVAIDPHSPAATLIKPLDIPLRNAGVKLLLPSTSDVVVAHGEFLDTLAAGRLRHAGQPELTAAVRAGTQRPMGGAVGWARRGEQVDGGPLRAATLACWAWTNRPPEWVPLIAWA
jgi:hypothetical protein